MSLHLNEKVVDALPLLDLKLSHVLLQWTVELVLGQDGVSHADSDPEVIDWEFGEAKVQASMSPGWPLRPRSSSSTTSLSTVDAKGRPRGDQGAAGVVAGLGFQDTGATLEGTAMDPVDFILVRSHPGRIVPQEALELPDIDHTQRLDDPVAEGILGQIEPSIFDALGVEPIGHRLLLARGILSLAA
eukprot:s3416_g5.t2